jgi:hypothetical protein
MAKKNNGEDRGAAQPVGGGRVSGPDLFECCNRHMFRRLESVTTAGTPWTHAFECRACATVWVPVAAGGFVKFNE